MSETEVEGRSTMRKFVAKFMRFQGGPEERWNCGRAVLWAVSFYFPRKKSSRRRYSARRRWTGGSGTRRLKAGRIGDRRRRGAPGGSRADRAVPSPIIAVKARQRDGPRGGVRVNEQRLERINDIRWMARDCFWFPGYFRDNGRGRLLLRDLFIGARPPFLRTRCLG